MLRNWSKWSISFRSKFFEIYFDRFCFDPVKISIIFDRTLSIKIYRNSFWSISIVGLRIEIFQNNFEKFRSLPKFRCQFWSPKWSKLIKIFSKIFEMVHFISNIVTFRFENPSKRNTDRSFATSWQGVNLINRFY